MQITLYTIDEHLDLIAWAYDHAGPETLDWLSSVRADHYPAVFVAHDDIANDLRELIADWEEVIHAQGE